MLRPEPVPPPAAPPTRWEASLDRVTQPRPAWCGTAASPYLVLGLAGATAGLAVLVLIGTVQRNPTIELLLEASAMVVTFIVAGCVRTSLGRGPHVLLEDLIIALVAVSGVAWVIGQPVLPSLDRAVVALGVFVSIGRLGCLASGCCHGRPSRTGVRYSIDAVGPALADVRLFPVQLVEALWIAVVTLGAACLIGLPPGSATSFWLVAYGFGRFNLEFARGDVERPYLGPLSEAQWTILVLTAAIALAQAWDGDQRVGADVAAFVAVCAILTATCLTRRWWWRRPADVLDDIDLEAWDESLDLLERDARRGTTEVECVAPTPGITVALSATAHGVDLAVATYRVTAPMHPINDREIIGGLIAERLALVKLLRSAITVDGYVLSALTLIGGERVAVEVHRVHVVDRIRSFAMLLSQFRSEGDLAMGSTSATGSRSSASAGAR